MGIADALRRGLCFEPEFLQSAGGAGAEVQQTLNGSGLAHQSRIRPDRMTMPVDPFATAAFTVEHVGFSAVKSDEIRVHQLKVSHVTQDRTRRAPPLHPLSRSSRNFCEFDVVEEEHGGTSSTRL